MVISPEATPAVDCKPFFSCSQKGSSFQSSAQENLIHEEEGGKRMVPEEIAIEEMMKDLQ